MKQVLCIYECHDGIPYFHFRSGERYGPAKNDVCTVLETLTCGVFDIFGREQVFYILEGYDRPDNRFVSGRVMFNSKYFVDLMSDDHLEALLEETVAVNFP